MTTRKNSNSTLKAKKGSDILYLCNRDEINGLDSYLDMQGYVIIAL